MNISYWNNKIGYLAQRTYLMDESIEKNIIYSHEKILDRGRINEVIKLSQLEEYIDKLPEKLATRIGENGILISGGQMQRIGIARALYTKPSLLILDEPTSAMDYENELQFLNMIKTLKNKVTVVIVTHRQTTLNICDQKYKLEDKQLKKIK
jgi:ATP-binding cassette subfamily C protein